MAQVSSSSTINKTDFLPDLHEVWRTAQGHKDKKSWLQFLWDKYRLGEAF